MNFKENLKRIREAKGFTQKELGLKLNSNIYAIRNYEQGKIEPKFLILEKLTIILECDYNELLK